LIRFELEYIVVLYKYHGCLAIEPICTVAPELCGGKQAITRGVKESVHETKSSIEDMKTKVDKIGNMYAGTGKVRQTGPVRAIRVPKLCRVSVYLIFDYVCIASQFV
jgi:hypothetical protein